MDHITTSKPIGKVLRSNTRAFVFGTKVPKTNVPVFGSLVKTKINYQDAIVYGLIYNIEILDDGMTKMLSVADDITEEELDWQRSRRVPVEASVLSVGYQALGDRIRYSLPAQPPITLDNIYACDEAEIVAFTNQCDYMRLIVESRDVPCDELLAASVRLSMAARPDGMQHRLACGRELARLLSHDSARLENLLRRMI